jgi:hypothetical protein
LRVWMKISLRFAEQKEKRQGGRGKEEVKTFSRGNLSFLAFGCITF